MTHFRDEAERQKAREAACMVATSVYIEARGWDTDRAFDRLYPPIVDAPECTCDMGDGPPMPRCRVHAPTPPDFDAAVDDALNAALRNTWRGKNLADVLQEPEVTTARQRVRELYEAVVRERDMSRQLCSNAVGNYKALEAELAALRAAADKEFTVVYVERTNVGPPHSAMKVVGNLPALNEGDRVRVVKVTP